MYCSQCGAQASGNFCSSCGARLGTPPSKMMRLDPVTAELATDEESTALPAPITAQVAPDWLDVLDYEMLLSVEEIREQIKRHAALSPKKLTGEEFLKGCDKAFLPLTGVPVSAIGAIAQPLYAKLGVQTSKMRSEVLRSPPGKVLLCVLCSLARRGRHLRHARQAAQGCVLEAVIPSDVWSFEGELVITLSRQDSGVLVEAGAVIKGQLFDWGKSERLLDELFSDLNNTPAVV